jgi:4,5-DOPA dioxygenase extradiol
VQRKTFLGTLCALPILPTMNTLQDLGRLAERLLPSEKMPVLFLGHGNPMNAISENGFVEGFRNIARTIPKPEAILCVSAHWLTRGTMVTAMEQPRTIHDFSGFPQALFEVQYPAPGSPWLAEQAAQRLSPAPVELDAQWGLDHGAWSVVKHLYPEADVPVVQMSIDYGQPPEYHYALAKRLSGLRRKGVLIIGSGNMVHNLGLVDFPNLDKEDYGFDWAVEARARMNGWLLDGDDRPFLEYQKQGKAVQLAVPTPDHFLPLIYALGLQETGDRRELFNDKLVAGSLSMTSVRIG